MFLDDTPAAVMVTSGGFSQVLTVHPSKGVIPWEDWEALGVMTTVLDFNIVTVYGGQWLELGSGWTSPAQETPQKYEGVTLPGPLLLSPCCGVPGVGRKGQGDIECP